MISDINQQLTRYFPFLAKTDDDLAAAFQCSATHAHLPKGQIICGEGMECNQFALVLSGRVRVYKLNEGGREITLYRVEAGQSCILTASCILSNSPFPATAVCESDVEAVTVPTTDVHRWMVESASWRDYIFSLIAERLATIISVVDEVVFRRMDRRIAGWLLQQAEDYRLPTTHQQIAYDLGTSREVVTRILREFEHQGWVSQSRGEIQLLDLPALQTKATETPI